MQPLENRPPHLLSLLLGGALVLSFGFNVLLLRNYDAAQPDDDDTELTAATAELHLTQRLLTQCQGHRQRQDSLLVMLRAYPTAATSPTSSPAFYSHK
jgi:hypothetical protein